MRKMISLSLALVLAILCGNAALAAETVNFEPIRAPSIGPENAPVTVVEIADFM